MYTIARSHWEYQCVLIRVDKANEVHQYIWTHTWKDSSVDICTREHNEPSILFPGNCWADILSLYSKVMFLCLCDIMVLVTFFCSINWLIRSFYCTNINQNNATSHYYESRRICFSICDLCFSFLPILIQDQSGINWLILTAFW